MFPLRSLVAFGLSSVALSLAAAPDALRWISYEDPVFPPELVATPVRSGFATLVFTFDDAGQITDRIVVAASHPVFVRPVYEAVTKWQVDTREPGPSVHRQSIRFNFAQHGSVVVLTHLEAIKAEFNALDGEAGPPLRTYRETELRSGLAALADGLPVFPPSLARKHSRGVATVNFIVDVDGRVRVPAVTNANDLEFGESALAAIRQWRFSPPLRDGVPVQVMADRTFRFGRGT